MFQKRLVILWTVLAVLVAASAYGELGFHTPDYLNTNAATDSGDDWEGRVVSNQSGTWIYVWQSNDSLSGTIGTDTDILMSRSTNNGIVWSAPYAVNNAAGGDSYGEYRPDVATDGNGTWIAAWYSNDSSGGKGSDTDIIFARSTDDGLTWSNEAALNTDATSDSGQDLYPRLATDGSGVWVATWYRGSTVYCARSTDDGVSWSAPVDPDPTGYLTYDNPCIATDGAGTWVIAARGYDPSYYSGMVCVRSTDNGATWTGAGFVTCSSNNKVPDIATDGEGNWVMVWEWSSSGNSAIYASYSTNNGATWSSRISLDSAASGVGSLREPTVATNGKGSWVAAWGQTIVDPSSLALVGSVSTDNGATWATEETITDSSIIDNYCYPMLASNGQNTWILAFQAEDATDNEIGQAISRHVSPKKVPRCPSAPGIDGNVDSNWAYSTPDEIATTLFGGSGRSVRTNASIPVGTWQTLWDDGGLYLLLEVTDSTLTTDSVDWWQDDSIEVMIDADHSQDGSYDGVNDFHYGFRWNDSTVHLGANSVDATTGVLHTMVSTVGGYRAEIAIPWTTLGVTPASGAYVGIDIVVNDDSDGGNTDTRTAWNNATDEADSNPTYLGAAYLLATLPVELSSFQVE